MRVGGLCRCQGFCALLIVQDCSEVKDMQGAFGNVLFSAHMVTVCELTGQCALKSWWKLALWYTF